MILGGRHTCNIQANTVYLQNASEGSPFMKLKILIMLTFLAVGRAMTILFIHRAGDGGIGDPPAAWLMPLIGDAVIGVAALGVGWLLVSRQSPVSWLIALVWSGIGAFDALAAWLVHLQTPWPDFFMVEIFGPSMFFGAAAMHFVILWLLTAPEIRHRFGLPVT